MKKIIFILAAIALVSCKDPESSEEEETKAENTLTVSSSDTLTYHLSKAIPIEGGFSISKQAEHFAFSEIQYRENGLYYVYVPKEGFTGTDRVEIKREDSNGAEIYSETRMPLTIKVTE